MTRFSAIVPVFLAPLLLAGCFPNPNYQDLPNASVITSTSSVIATVAVADNAKPTEAELAAVAEGLSKGGDSGLRVQVRLPQGAPVPPADEMRRRISSMGVDPAIAVVEPNASASGTSLVFVRITVTAPDCAALVTRSEEWSAWSRPRMSFGCATYTNLSRMVADPADLAAPRSFGGADATTSAAAVGRYQTDKVTPLKRNSSTSGYSSSSSQ
ncbi:MAG: CpaD family pilus assembly lipoprotein [Bacteroidota bacterium]